MKKRISCFILAAFMVVTTCFSGISSLVYASDQENTEVTALSIANNGFKFKLSVNDYGTSNPNNHTANSFTAEYNYMDNILVYTDSTTSYKLKDKYTAVTNHNF